jgi:cytochrome P450
VSHVHIDTFDEVEEVLRQHQVFLAEDNAAITEFSSGLLSGLNGREHVDRRRWMSKLFEREQLRRYHRSFGEALRATLHRHAHRRLQAPDGLARFDLIPEVRRVFYRIAADLIGLDGIDDAEARDRLDSCVVRIIEGRTVEFSKRDRETVFREALEAKEEFRLTFFQASYDRRLGLVRQHHAGRLAEDELPIDMIALMTRAQEEGKDGTVSDAGLVLRQSFHLLQAVVNNPTAIGAWSLAELERWLAAHPEDAALRSDDHFLHKVVIETVRLHATGSPSKVRRAAADVTLRSGRMIPAGRTVAVHLVASGLTSAAFGADPLAFDPHRVVTEPKVKPYGHAFGTGPHVCIGRPLVIGTDDAETAVGSPIGLGLQVQLLRRLLDAGVRSDPARPPVKVEHEGDRFTSYPVVIAR